MGMTVAHSRKIRVQIQNPENGTAARKSSVAISHPDVVKCALCRKISAQLWHPDIEAGPGVSICCRGFGPLTRTDTNRSLSPEGKL